MRSHHHHHHHPTQRLPPPRSSPEYSTRLATIAAHIIYRSPLPSPAGLPIYVLDAAALPDFKGVDYDALLPYVLGRLPDEEELILGKGYEILFFAGGAGDGVTKKGRPGWGWFAQAYHVLTRTMRKRLQKLYICHSKTWVRVLIGMFSTIVSPKFSKKIMYFSSITSLALYLPIEELLIPISAYLYDRRFSPDIHAPYVTGRRAFGATHPLPISSDGHTRLPRVLREASKFILFGENVKHEGIFRLAPQAQQLDILKEAYNRGQKFIIWKEGSAVFSDEIWHEEENNELIDEMEHKDGYGVLLAAAIIKLWYRDLREPLVPPSSYRELSNLFGDEKLPINHDRLVELIAPTSSWSIISQTSRLIITSHLLPLLSEVAKFQEFNKMTANNLSICIAPGLICGPDPLEDLKIVKTLTRVLRVAIEEWEISIRAACGIEADKFINDLKPPARVQDYDDPLEPLKPRAATQTQHENTSSTHLGVISLGADDSTAKSSNQRPALSPRPMSAFEEDSTTLTSAIENEEPVVKRKPAPPLGVPPRYSMAIAVNDAITADGFRPQNRGITLAEDAKDPIVPESNISRSPMTEANTTDGFRPPDAPVQLSISVLDEGISPKKDPLSPPAYDGMSSSPPPPKQAPETCTSEEIKRKPLPSRSSSSTYPTSTSSSTSSSTSTASVQPTPTRAPTSPSPTPSPAPTETFSPPLRSLTSPSRPTWAPTMLNLAKPINPCASITTISWPPTGIAPPTTTAIVLRSKGLNLDKALPPITLSAGGVGCGEKSGEKGKMATGEVPQRAKSDYGPRRKLKLQGSVGDLTRLYEERAAMLQFTRAVGR
ncbi:MAG: hypothetical protein M1829_002881 [Trizodia sp. TS-e1964]|nr:MAG: hypothetical protein M1829_002881 [Trizodia sp. TS-e1964]